MKAVQIHDYGTADDLVFEDAPIPEPGPGQVRVRLHAAGVNPADGQARAGRFRQWRETSFPWIPGLEGAGQVDALGEGVTALQVGQAVLGPIYASYAEYAVAEATDLALKPAALSFEEAATVTIGGLTAWQTVETAGVQAGQHVLVQGGPGGVGMFVVQLAAARGAHVSATASAANLDFVRSLGAEQVIDYNAQKFEQVVSGLDAVIDTVGGDVTGRSWGVLKPGGILVSVAAPVTPEEAEKRGLRAARTGRAPIAALKEIVALIEANRLRTEVDHVFALSDAIAAQKMCETGHGRGRLVIKIAD
jgi:NADPH:quinone reductase-like Zn-dependent oxidoreductase